ncbi:RNA polymerase sigma factor [Pedobacter endophyticus]|uniref:Sigma-70 family RNA polymerase sigma factor n=1 Tax=Pedobacter endophyticus TaxID=2789740 RepID=A0A7S9KZE7_9SPHI|nr:sigma-70 family RNA polymerase sigma factor [Pedobacter endophyticus]QPH39311.1 sigma-70 family RNA polymerase sigma factor [Pedobacter endophyticus]
MPNYIQNIRKGDHASFEMVFKLYHRKLYAYFFSKTKSEDQAEELTQMAFIKLWRFKHTLADDFPLDTQLFKIAKTTLLDYFKKLANDARNLKIYCDQISAPSVDPSPLFDSEQQLDVILGCLPPTRKQVFLLNRLHGYSYKEIAEKLSISPRTVEKHIALALKQLSGYANLPALLLFIELMK